MAGNLTTQGNTSDDSAAALVPSDEWIQQFGTVGNDEAYSVTVDGEGNVYVSGTTEGDLGGTNAGGKDAWVAKYDPRGTRLWVKQWGMVDNDFGRAIDVDRNGNVYIVGESSRTEQINGYQTTDTDGFIVKYDSSGDREWVEILTTEPSSYYREEVNEIAVDSAGNIYVAGTAGDLGVGGFDDLFGTEVGPFLVKYDANGDRLWLKQTENGDEMMGPHTTFGDITFDNADNVYITTNTSYPEGSPNASVVKYDSNGNELSSQSSFAPGFIQDISIDNENNLYSLASTLTGGPYNLDPVSKVILEKNGFQLQQVKEVELGSKRMELGEDSESNLYFSINTTRSDKYLAIAKYNNAGGLIWEQELNPKLDYSGITVGSDGKIYLAGTTDGVIGGSNAGGSDAWVVKLDPDAATTIVSNGLTLDEGATSTITSSQLQATDAGDSNYIVTALPANGTLKLNDIEVVLSDTFTQADIDGGKLTYTHDSSETKDDSFSFTAPNSQFWQGNKFQIAVNPVNDAPINIAVSQNNIAENSVTGTVVGQLGTIDIDSDAHTYTLLDDAEGRFVIEGNQLKVADGANLDFESNTSHIIKVRTADNGEPAQSFEKEFAIEVTDVNDAPADITLSKNTVKENSPTGTVVGKLNTADADSDTHTYSLIEDAGGRFVIEGNELKVADGANLDFETATTHAIKIRSADSGAQSFEKELLIEVTDVSEAPTDITLSKNTVKENSGTGTVIGKLNTADADSETHTYTLVKNPGGRFVIEGNELKVADGSKLDFEKNSSHTIKIRTADSGTPSQNFSKEFAIEVTDVEDNTVKSTSSHRLGATKENLNLTGKKAIDGTGNNLDNRLRGNNAKNRLRGKDGNDVLIGRGGNDVLIGDKGNDRLNGGNGNDNLNGGKGRDTMTGGAGNDTFVVDNVKDVIKESARGGSDAIKSSVSYGLPGQVENLTLAGKRDINGTGNNLKNRIVGNDGKNRLNGKGGSDILVGADGNDTLIGGGGGDRLIGNQGRDLLNGGVGNDTLTGGGGSDRFIFNTGKSYRQSSPGKDVIRDFKNKDRDKIILDKTTFGALDSKAGNGFSVIAEFDVVKRDAAVAGKDAVIVYNENNGKLFYNANGSNNGLGAGGVFAVLDNSPGLQANDFIIRG